MKVKNKMTKKEKEYFKKLIIKQKEEILEEIKRISEDTLRKSQKDATGDISGYTYHMADVATDTYDREFSLGLATDEHKIIYELNDALKRLEEDTYGICENCKNPIPKTRLKAIPYARFCIKCQQAKEKS